MISFTRKCSSVCLLSLSLVFDSFGRYEISNPTDCSYLDPVFRMFPIRRINSKVFANFLDCLTWNQNGTLSWMTLVQSFSTSLQAAMTELTAGLHSFSNSGKKSLNFKHFNRGRSLRKIYDFCIVKCSLSNLSMLESDKTNASEAARSPSSSELALNLSRTS